MNVWRDFLFGNTVTRDQLGTLAAGPHSDRFRPPPPPLPAGQVFYGLLITREMWAEYEAAGGDRP